MQYAIAAEVGYPSDHPIVPEELVGYSSSAHCQVEQQMRLAAKIALVTGAASGFGAEIARTFARAGARVVLLDINAGGAQAVAASIGPEALAIVGDVTSAGEVTAAVERTLA